MRTTIAVGVALLAGLAGLICLDPGDLVSMGLAKMEQHQALSGWFQAVFSVVAIAASTWIAVLIPREQRRLEKRDQCVRALTMTVLALKHAAGTLHRLIDPLQTKSFTTFFARAMRLELEGRLDDLAGVQIDAVPQRLSDNLFEIRAMVRLYCSTLNEIESGAFDWRKLPIQTLTESISDIVALERRCRSELGRHAPKRQRQDPGLLDDGKSYAAGFVTFVTSTRPSPSSKRNLLSI